MPNSDSQPRKRKADCLEINNHEVVHNQAANQEVHGSQYFGNVNYYNKVPDVTLDKPISAGILDSLAFDGMLDRKASIAQPYHGTCDWIFDLKEYRDWKELSRGLLWIKGKPGSGKSTMMSFLFRELWAEDLEAEAGMSPEQRVKDTLSLHFFFNARGSELQHTIVGMLRSLLHQLLRQCPGAGTIAMATYREKRGTYGTDLQAWTWQQSELEQLFCDALIASSLHRSITVFVDALDEAGEHAAQHIARYIHRINDLAANLKGSDDNRKGCLKFCISSRHYPVASAVKGLEVWMEKHNKNDMEIFVDRELNNLGWSAEDVDTFDRLKSHISARAEGVFQWVSSIIPILLNEYANGWLAEHMDMDTYLNKLPRDLEDVYSRIIRGLDRDRISESFLLFKWVHLAYRPLGAIEITSILSSDGRFTTLNGDVMARRIRALSGGLIEVVNFEDSPDTEQEDLKNPTSENFKVWRPVQVIHQTVGDFLARAGLRLLSCLCDGCDVDSISHHGYDQTAFIQECHATIYWHCLNYYSSIESKTVESFYERCKQYHCEFFDNIHEEKAVCKDMENEPCLRLMDYATRHMFYHGCQASDHECHGGCRHPERQSEIEMLERIRLRWTLFYQRFHSVRRRDTVRPPQPDSTWSTTHIAVAYGLCKVTEILTDTGHTVSLQDENGHTPLHIACWNGDYKICEILLRKGAPVNSLNRSRHSPLCLAAVENHTAVMTLLLENRAQMHHTIARRENALYQAARFRHYAAVKLLIDKGVDLYAHGNHLGNVIEGLLNSSASDEQIEIMTFLLAAGADNDFDGSYYSVALPMAARTSVKTVRLLLAAGADVNSWHYDRGLRMRATALHSAASTGNIEVMQLLLDAGAGVDDCHEHSGTALQVAIHCSYRDPVPVKFLLDAGADVNAKGGRYGSALCAVLISTYHQSDYRKQIVQTLLDAGANVNSLDELLGTPLQVAAANPYCDVDLIRFLLEAGADVSAQGARFGSALEAASEFHDVHTFPFYYTTTPKTQEQIQLQKTNQAQKKQALLDAGARLPGRARGKDICLTASE